MHVVMCPRRQCNGGVRNLQVNSVVNEGTYVLFLFDGMMKS